MSDTTALHAALPPPPGAPPPGSAVTRRLSEETDLYAEGNSFSEADWAGPGVEALFGKDGFGFEDVLDIVNPLHHLPVVGTAYRAFTGDTLAPGPRILGGTLFGGIAGFVAALANAIHENETGKDMGDTVLALLADDAVPGAVVASTPPAAAPPSAAAAATPAPAVAGLVPGAPSPLAIAGHAKTAGIPLDPRSAETEDPAEALIRARAAVPMARRPGATGLPATNFRSSLVTPGGKTLPIHFQSGAASSAPKAPSSPNSDPAAAIDTGGDPAAAKPAPEQATAVAPAIAPPAARKSPPGDKVAADTPPDVAVLMQRALDKYETLMKRRTAPSISSEI